MARWTDEQRLTTLARLEANGGNLLRTAEDTGVPIATLSRWRDRLIAARPEPPPTPLLPVADFPLTLERMETNKPTDYAAMWGDVQREAVQVVRDKLHEASAKDAAIIAGIAADKLLDYTLGRRGTTVNVNNDNRSLALPPGTTIDDLRALRDELRLRSS